MPGPARKLSAVRLRPLQALAALTVLAAGLRLATIDVQSFWFDEALTVKLLRLPLADMVALIPDTELTPPLYYVLAWPWARLFGTGETALRGFSALIGTLTVPIAYAVGRELAARRTALVIAALTAFNPLLIWYSQETRPYALFVLLGALGLLLFLWAAARRDTASLVGWAAVSVLALLTHYFAVFVIVPQGLWLLRTWAGTRARVLAAGAVVTAVGLALVPLAAHQKERISTGYISSVSLPRRVLGLPEDFLTGFVVSFNTRAELVLGVVAAAAAAAGLWLLLRRAEPGERRAAWLTAAVGGSAVALPLVLAIGGLDVLNTRNLLVAWLPLMLVPAIGLGTRRAGRAGLAATAVLCAVGVATTAVVAADSELQRSDWRGIAESVGPPGAQRALVVPAISGEVSLGVYLPGLAPPAGDGARRVRELVLATVLTERLDARGPRPSGAPDPAPPAVPGFRLAERRVEPTFVLFRYRARGPGWIDERTVARLDPVVPAPTLLVQAPPGEARADRAR